MTTANIGIRSGNVIVPYVSATKRTKELALVKTTDLTAATSGASLGTYLITRGVAVFYADSNNVWRMCFNIRMSCDSGTRQDVAFTFPNVVFKTVTGLKQAVAVGISAATEIGGSSYASASGSSNTIGVEHASTATTAYYISGNVELNAEPTTYTIAANMEGVVAADFYIAPAAAGTAGLVNNVAGNTVGTPILGRTSGSVAQGYVGEVLGPTTSSTFTPGTAGYKVSGATVTLTTGTWLLFGEFYSETTGATEERVTLSTDGSDGSAGIIAPSFFGYSKGTSSNGAITAIPTSIFVVTGATQIIYGKAIAVSGTPAAGAKFVVTPLRVS